MRKVSVVLVVAVLAATLVTGLAAVVAGGGPRRETLRFRTRDVHIFGGTQRLGPRDDVAVSASLRRAGRRVGRMRQSCTVTDRSETLLCTVTLALEGRGQIAAQGPWQGVTAFQRTAVTGGTGGFVGAGGGVAWDLGDRALRVTLVR